jgi:hypothetical protein
MWVTSIPFWGELWHAFHKSTITYGGLSIVVPSSFYLRESESGPAMWRFSLGYPILHTAYGLISVYGGENKHAFVYATDYGSFAYGVTTAANEEGFVLSGSRRVPMAGTVADCLEFRIPNNGTQSLVRCAVENSPVFFFYRGHPKYIPVFLSTLRSVSTSGA